MDQKGRCLSAASFGLSHFLQRINGNPKGKSAVAFFCLHFLGEARKVSSYRATPGRQSNINNKSTNKTKQQQTKNSPRHRAYSMRLFKHAGLRGAWNMRSGVACI
jgi:hypothetical protein